MKRQKLSCLVLARKTRQPYFKSGPVLPCRGDGYASAVGLSDLSSDIEADAQVVTLSRQRRRLRGFRWGEIENCRNRGCRYRRTIVMNLNHDFVAGDVGGDSDRARLRPMLYGIGDEVR